MAVDEEYKQRRYAKATLTRFINKADVFIVENDTPGLMSHLEKTKDAFKKFESAHEKYHGLLEDDNDVEASDKYFFEEQSSYIAAMKRGNEYLQEKKPAEAPKVKEELGSQDVMQMMNSPRIELDKFDGDPLCYHAFRAMIAETIDPLDCNGKVKLTRLLQCCAENVKKKIRHCMTFKEGDAYEEAKKILEKKFGDPFLVMDRIVKSLRSEKEAKSPSEVQVLSDEIVSAHTTLKEMGMLVEVDSQGLIVDVIKRFPFSIQKNWRKYAMKQKKTKEAYPGFGELAKFVSEESDEMNDPVYGQLFDKPEGHNRKNLSKSSSSFATNVSEASNSSSYQFRRPPCMLCSEDHRLLYCSSFKNLKLSDRLNYVRDNKLCENCLLGNHTTSNCRKSTVCDVGDCGQKHTRLIHVSRDNVNVINSDQNVKIVHASETGVSVHMPVVTVRVNDRHVTTALLDTASSSTFCSEKLVKSLGLRGVKTTLTLNTLNASEKRESKLVNFDIASESGDERLKLNNVYVVEKIPLNVPVADTPSFAHLNGLKFAGSGAEVHILIGQDHAEALMPMETRSGSKGEPFAVKTLLGWTLNGPGHSSSKEQQSVISHFVNVGESLDRKIDCVRSGVNESVVQELPLSQNDANTTVVSDEQCESASDNCQISLPRKDNDVVSNAIKMTVSSKCIDSTKHDLEKGDLSGCEDEVTKLCQSECMEQISSDENFFPAADNPAPQTRGQDPESIVGEKLRLDPKYLRRYMSQCKPANDDSDVRQCDVSTEVTCTTTVRDHSIDQVILKCSSCYMLTWTAVLIVCLSIM